MTKHVLGIRREDKNRWERRVPLIPADARKLIAQGYELVVQPSPIRVYPDAEWAALGAKVQDDLDGCSVVLGVKEMPTTLFRQGGVYVYFAHVAKGQKYNMPMLKELLAKGSTLVDYEKIVDDKGRRLVFFGRHAGLAGTIDSLWALGRRLEAEGLDTAFATLEPAHAYRELDDAKRALALVGQKIAEGGLPPSLVPFVAGVTGYGHVGGGAMEILEALGAREVSPADLPALFQPGGADPKAAYRVTFKEEHTVVPAASGAPFELREFFEHPERYRGVFDRFVPQLTVLLNCVYWDAKYPRLVTKSFLRRLWAKEETPRLRVIGDITCDILGSVECNVKATSPDDPVYVWDVDTDKALDGVEGRGPVVLAVDNLPCELPAESSTSFGHALMPFIPRLLEADWSQPFERLELPRELADAVIAHRGKLTPKYAYISGLW
jgi:saccharopine dehydrogenase (NAD+, L-lysine forming)